MISTIQNTQTRLETDVTWQLLCNYHTAKIDTIMHKRKVYKDFQTQDLRGHV